MSLHVLFAHPKQAWTPERVAEACAELRKLLAAGGYGACRVESGREAWDRLFAACGRNWDRWAEEVGGGESVDGDPTFDLYVLPGVEVARATARIVEAALRAGRPVLSWEDGKFRRVTAIRDENPSDRWFGWRCELAP